MGFTPVFEVRKKAWSILRDSIQYSYPSMLSERCFTLDIWMWISSKSGGFLICGLVFFEGIKDRYRCFIVHLGQFIRDCVIHSRCFTCPSCSGQTIQPIALLHPCSKRFRICWISFASFSSLLWAAAWSSGAAAFLMLISDKSTLRVEPAPLWASVLVFSRTRFVLAQIWLTVAARRACSFLMTVIIRTWGWKL